MLLTAPVDVRSVSLVMIAVLASLYVLHWASAVIVPLMLGLMFSYALTPLVNRMVRLHVPRTLAAAALLIGILGGTRAMAYSLSGDAAAMIESLPDVAQNVVTPWLTGKASRMNPVAVFVGVLAWGWLWGLWGLFLGVPILMAIKAVCDRVDDFKSVGELLGA